MSPFQIIRESHLFYRKSNLHGNNLDFYITISFEIQLGKLCKKPKEGYCTCRKDICKQFPKNITFQILWERPVMLLEQDGLKIIKENACNSYIIAIFAN